MVAGLKLWWVGVVALGVSASALASEGLPDPTRPAAGFAATTGSTNAGASTAADATPAAAVENLQSVILSPQRNAAVINGETIELGEKFNGATLIEVREASVVLKDARGIRQLSLYPGVSIKKVEVVKPPVTEAVAASMPPSEVKPVSKKAGKNKKAPKPKQAAQTKDEVARK